MARIKKFKNIKNLGLYKNFCWPANLNGFNRYNIIYGWNGVGKTTLSKLFEAMGSGEHSDFIDLQYSIEDENSKIFRQGQPFGTKIRIFNTDFIANNVNFNSQSSKTISVYLGEENQQLVKAIENDEKLLEKRHEEINEKTNLLSSKQTERGKIFTNIARTISQGIKQVAARNYNKQNAINSYNKLTSKDHMLSEEELNRLGKSVSQDIMDTIPSISIIDGDYLDDAILNMNELLSKTISNVTIQRLKDNLDISEWVENGLALHAKYNNEKCEFCGQPLTDDRINELLGHFNEADAQIKFEIDELADKFRNVYASIDGIKLVDPARFYTEYRSEYEELEKETTLAIRSLLKDIENMGKLIVSKKKNTTTAVKNNLSDPDFSRLETYVNRMNSIIKKAQCKD